MWNSFARLQFRSISHVNRVWFSRATRSCHGKLITFSDTKFGRGSASSLNNKASKGRHMMFSSSSGGSGSGGDNGGKGNGDWSSGDDFSGGVGLAAIWAVYLKLLEVHPWPTKILTSAALNAVGDILGQSIFERDKKFDWARFAKFTFLGGALVAPVLGVWYGVLNSAIPGSGFLSVIAKTFLDQAIFAPCFVAMFISSLMCLDGTPNLIMSKLKQDLAPTVVANWTLWIPGQIINFQFVPANLTLLFSNFIALIWCTYLSWAANRKVKRIHQDP